MSSAVPLITARDIDEARRLVESQNLVFEEPVDDVVGIHENGRLVATASRAGYVLKMFAIEGEYQGEGTLGLLATALIDQGRAAGHEVFFVFTRPEHASAFEQLNFRLLVSEGTAALLEYGRGLEAYLSAHAHLRRPGFNAAVVINGNPFTLGHLYLVETAARHVDNLYVFIVREDRSVFPFAVRERLAREATAHVGNAIVLETSRYAVSAGTFPSYFLKRSDEAARAQMRIDLRLFASHLAPAFGVTRRYVGHEPYCETTAAYNEAMAELLPQHGIELVEIRRLGSGDSFVSATRVREAMERGLFDELAALVPAPTLAFLKSPEGRAIAARLASSAAGS